MKLYSFIMICFLAAVTADSAKRGPDLLSPNARALRAIKNYLCRVVGFKKSSAKKSSNELSTQNKGTSESEADQKSKVIYSPNYSNRLFRYQLKPQEDSAHVCEDSVEKPMRDIQ